MKKILFVLGVLVLFFLTTLFLSNSVLAQSTITIECNDGTVMNVGASLAANGDPCGSHGGTENNPSGAGNQNQSRNRTSGYSGDVDSGAGDELNDWINNSINVLSAAVGLVIVGSIIFAGIQYQTARDNAQQVTAAKNRIAMAILSLMLYFFAYAILQWLIPGGIF